MAFIGDPCPTNRTGIFSTQPLFAGANHSNNPASAMHVYYLIIAKEKRIRAQNWGSY